MLDERNQQTLHEMENLRVSLQEEVAGIRSQLDYEKAKLIDAY